MNYELVHIGVGMIGFVSRSIKEADTKEELEDYCVNTLKRPLTKLEDVGINVHDYPFYVIKDHTAVQKPLEIPPLFKLNYETK